MTNYRRSKIEGGTYFLTQVTHQRQPWLCTDIARSLLRAAFLKVRQKYPFASNYQIPELFLVLSLLSDNLEVRHQNIAIHLIYLNDLLCEHHSERA